MRTQLVFFDAIGGGDGEADVTDGCDVEIDDRDGDAVMRGDCAMGVIGGRDVDGDRGMDVIGG